ncbi:hypothetical protein [Streptomyces aquilus]|uniref:hypothetical protein n=1 Tax=Streptomyces aquilus TaxID=2548456 RepID=UPI00368CF32A
MSLNRTPFPTHPLARKPLNNIFAAVSLAGFIAVLGAFGGAALGITFLLWGLGLLVWGFRYGQKQLRAVEADRALAVKAHAASMADRMLYAQRRGLEFEASSAAWAEGFGRIPQEVPDRLSEEQRVRARHAADLVAEGVLRMRGDDLPVTVFDLEMINQSDVWELKKRCRYSRAAEAAKYYLTVCVVTLPMPLPYVASAHLHRNPEDPDRTEDPEFAELLLSRPGVREAALDRDWLWSVDGGRLICCAVTSRGTDIGNVEGLADRMAALAGAFPWPELERFRVPARGSRPRCPLWINTPDLLIDRDAPFGGLIQIWVEKEIDRTGLHALTTRTEWLARASATLGPSA